MVELTEKLIIFSRIELKIDIHANSIKTNTWLKQMKEDKYNDVFQKYSPEYLNKTKCLFRDGKYIYIMHTYISTMQALLTDWLNDYNEDVKSHSSRLSYTSKQSRTPRGKKSVFSHKKSSRANRKDNRRIDDHSTITSFPNKEHPDHISYNYDSIQESTDGQTISQYAVSFLAVTHINKNPSRKGRLSAAISLLDSAFTPGCNKGIQGIPDTAPSTNALFMTWANHLETQNNYVHHLNLLQINS